MKKKVVIVGGGFGGLELAKRLGNKRHVKVCLLDRRNYHLFQPLLYQVAMAGLSPAEIAVPIRSIVSGFKNITVHLANVEDIDLKNKKIVSDIGDIPYDYLVLACGAKHSYFGSERWEEVAPGLKTLEQATEIRRRILMAFEKAETEADVERRNCLLTFIIVGGGPTGVELAGAIAELSHHTLTNDFRNIHPELAKIFLLEAGDRILPTFSSKSSMVAMKDLNSLGVTVKTNSLVTEIASEGVFLGNDHISGSTVLWAAGVQASSLNKKLGVELDKNGRVFVNSDLSLPGIPNVFVIGDQALVKDRQGKTLPGLAPVAIQQGRFLADLVLKDNIKNIRPAFEYKNKGQLATIGKKRAIVEYRSIKIYGLLAWFVWLFVHIYYLIGFKNKVFTLFQWAWGYFSYKRGARLIVHKEWKSFLRTNKLE